MLKEYEGEHGHIWENNETQYKAGIFTHTKANKICKHFNDSRRYKQGEECLIKFSPEDLDYVLGVLEIPK